MDLKTEMCVEIQENYERINPNLGTEEEKH